MKENSKNEGFFFKLNVINSTQLVMIIAEADLICGCCRLLEIVSFWGFLIGHVLLAHNLVVYQFF